MPAFPLVGWSVFEPRYEPDELFDCLVIGSLSLFHRGQFRFSQHAAVGIAAGPGHDRGGPLTG